MDFALLDSLGSFWTLFSYIITVIIGGVGYRFYKLHIDDKQVQTKTEIDINQQSINSLMEQVGNFSLMYKQQGDRILGLEEEQKKLNQRLLEATKSYIKAESEVKLLQEKVRYLEGILEHYTDLDMHTFTRVPKKENNNDV